MLPQCLRKIENRSGLGPDSIRHIDNPQCPNTTDTGRPCALSHQEDAKTDGQTQIVGKVGSQKIDARQWEGLTERNAHLVH